MSSADNGKTEPRFHPGKRTVMGLFALLFFCYIIGYGVVYAWSEDIDVIPKVKSILGITAAGTEATLVNETVAPPKPLPTKKKQRRFARDEPLPDNLPIVDEFTESFKEGRPVLPESQDEVFLNLPQLQEPDGVAISKALQPLVCWDSRGFEHDKEQCDSLFALNQFLKSKLDVFQKCRDDIEGGDRTQSLRFNVEADFVRESLSFWSEQRLGAKTQTALLDCVATNLRDASIDKIPHRHSRYRLWGEIRFKGAKAATVTPGAPPTSEKEMAKLDKALAEAKEVAVIRERVRVRKSPVDGEIIGFISSPAKVKLIEKADEWCLVKTKRGNVGWMVCWGLSAEPTPAPKPQADAAPTPQTKTDGASGSKAPPPKPNSPEPPATPPSASPSK